MTTNPILLRDALEKKIYGFGLTIWKEKWEPGSLAQWLGNFAHTDARKQEQQELNMLYLLSKFMFFGSKQVRELLVSLFRDLYKYPIIASIRKANGNTTDAGFLEARFVDELKATRFLGVGNPSESGVHLLYYFRQENKLLKSFFINTSEIFARRNVYPGFVQKFIARIPFLSRILGRGLQSEIANPAIRRYIFIDDLCGSGSQAKQYLQKLVTDLKFMDPTVEVNYFMLFGTEAGVKAVRNLGIFDSVEAVFTLDETFKAFSTVSRYYKFVPEKKSIKRLFAKTVAKDNGEILVQGTTNDGYPLGWRDGQLLLALFHNTPDNTLPIFWSDAKNWKPVFRRYDKIYSIP